MKQLHLALRTLLASPKECGAQLMRLVRCGRLINGSNHRQQMILMLNGCAQWNAHDSGNLPTLWLING
jgi:hypothetical protein